MFIFIDVTTLQKEIKRLMARCLGCSQESELILIKTFQCLRLFFIPVWRWGERYYIVHPNCGTRYEISEEDGILVQYGKKTLSECQVVHLESAQPICTSCRRSLDRDYEFCPYCGHKRK